MKIKFLKELMAYNIKKNVYCIVNSKDLSLIAAFETKERAVQELEYLNNLKRYKKPTLFIAYSIYKSDDNRWGRG